MILPLLASDIGLTGASPMVRVLQVDAYPIFNPGRTDSVVVNANVDVFSQQRTSGGYADLGPGQKATLPVTSRAPAPGETRSRGWLVLSWQNRSGESQSLLLPAGR